MNKNIVIGFLVIVILILGYIVLIKPKEVSQTSPVVTIVPTTPPVATSTPPKSTPGFKTYADTKYDFTIQYPDTFKTDVSNDGGFYNELNLYTLSIRVPVDYQKGTDFNIGTVELSVSPTTSSCYSSDSQTQDMTVTKTINGIVFHYNPKQPMDDSAMGGQRGSTSLFSTIQNGQCYRITKTIGYHDLKGFTEPPYPPHFDEQKVNTDLDAIISSLVIK